MIVYYIVLITVIQVVSSGRGGCKNRHQQECIVPNPPVNGRFSIKGTRSSPSTGDRVPSGTIITTRCNGQYKLKGASSSHCYDGQWSEKVGQCLELCPPLISTAAMKVRCATHNRKSTGNCRSAINGTVATLRCAEYYEDLDLNRDPFRRCIDGKWNKELPNCRPICGMKPSKETVENNRTSYPWNVGIFVKTGPVPFYRCTGSLLAENLVLTIANCVSPDDIGPTPAGMYLIGAGKTSGVFNESRDSASAQFVEVDEVFIPKSYKGSDRKYWGNIAIIVTKTPFKMTAKVQPICVDWDGEFQDEFIYPGTKGLIPGPLKTNFYSDVKDVFEIEVPFINDTSCYNQLTAYDVEMTDFQSFYSYDKLCSGAINEDRSPNCLVDVGAGLVSKTQYNDKYYITGIVSSYPSIHGPDCNNKKFLLFTDISKYMDDFIIPNSKNSQITTRRAQLQTACGVKSVKAATLIVNGQNVTISDYPWQVALYTLLRNTTTLSCGGSLLNPRVILTAAHCVTDIKGRPRSKEMFLVAVGKYYRNFDDPRDKNTQFSSIQEIFVPEQYKGDDQNFVADIAVMVTVDSFSITRHVQPICIDWDGKLQSQFLTESSTGFVAGWGYTEEDSSPSDFLKDLEVPYVDEQMCKEQLPPDYEIYLTSDKMCSGFSNKSVSVCRGDSGGGLVFKNKKDGRYYITGIVSLSPQSPTGGCDSQRYGLYTLVSDYISSFILSKVNLYWA